MIGRTLCRLLRSPIHLTTILLVGLVFLPSTALGDNVTLRMITWLPLKVPPYPMLQAWADDIHNASSGTLTIAFDPKPSAPPTKQYELVQNGEADLAFFLPTYNPDRFPMLRVAELPLLSAHTVTDSQALWEWYTKHIGEKEFGAVKLLTLWLPSTGILHSQRAVQTLEDMKGLKIRVPGGSIVEMAKTLDSVPVSLPLTKLAESLKQGTADATLTGWLPLKLFRLQSVLKYHLEPPEGCLFTVPFVVGINRDKFASLEPAHQEVLEKFGGPYGAAFLARELSAVAGKIRQEIKSQEGHVTHVLDANELARWREKFAPLEAQWVEQANSKGYDGAALLEELKATMKRYAANKD